ncbi:MAG: HAD family hydrolase [Synergistaceae bacterium]|nr:HAD family hydrolase [Synergistaceae bacterium]
MGVVVDGKRAAVFLDRDGTIIELKNYLRSFDEIKLIPHAAEGLKILQDTEYLLVVITNQSGVARGYFTEDFVKETNDRISELFAEQGVFIDAFYYCPHHPDYGVGAYRQDCECRKPKMGMIKKAVSDFCIDLSESWIIGDNDPDIRMAINAHIKSALVKTGYGEEVLLNYPEDLKAPDIIANDIYHAAKLIASRNGENR